MKKYLLFFGLSFCLLQSCSKPTNNPIGTTPNVGDNNNSSQSSDTSLSKVLSFSFDDNDSNATYETKTQSRLARTNGPILQTRIDGVSGKAGRIFSYFGWYSGSVNQQLPSNSVTVSGWIAPTSYPVQRKDQDPIDEQTIAAIFTNQNQENTKGISLGINHLGSAIGRISVDNQVTTIVSYDAIPLDQWSHIALNVNAKTGIIELYINGVKDRSNTFTSGNITWNTTNEILLGRGAKIKTLAGFNTNGLQGAIDEVAVWNRSMNSTEIENEFNQYNPAEPNLAIDITQEYASNDNRPKYHLTPPFGWTNEPHGFFYLNNEYHIFNQQNENGPYWSHINWGHYTSTNLLHWEDQGQVLYPEPGFDEVGIWSGHVALKNGNPFLFYTGVNKARAGIGMATSSPPYNEWTKLPGNPIIPNVPSSPANADFRDPFVFNHNDQWYMMVGTGLREGNARGGLFLYKSNDTQLRNWSLVGDHIMYAGNLETGDVGHYWEMPLYHNFGDKTLLLVNRLKNNSKARAIYWTGSFNGEKFIPENETPRALELTDNMLSPAIGLDEEQRLVAIGIIPDEIDSGSHRSQGWAHSLSLPRVWILDNNELIQRPHPNLENIKGELIVEKQNLTIRPGNEGYLDNVSANNYKIEASFNSESVRQVGFVLHRNGNEQTKIYYDSNVQELVVDRTNSSLLGGVGNTKTLNRTSIELPNQQEWEIFVDASIVEVFINGNKTFSTRIFPSSSQRELDLFAVEGEALFSSIRVFNMEVSSASSKSVQSKLSFVKKQNEIEIKKTSSFDKTVPIILLDSKGKIIEEKFIFPTTSKIILSEQTISKVKHLIYTLDQQTVFKALK